MYTEYLYFAEVQDAEWTAQFSTLCHCFATVRIKSRKTSRLRSRNVGPGAFQFGFSWTLNCLLLMYSVGWRNTYVQLNALNLLTSSIYKATIETPIDKSQELQEGSQQIPLTL
jgi:hypothetical protein